MKKLLTGDEAIARGAYEAGVHFAAAYPGTPSTEILENLSTYDEICSEWAPNEKVALESAIGASIAGGRAMASMKHVGLNVAADPFFTFAYTGVNGGAVIISADEPGQHSAQNEQDNRNYAKAAKTPMFEPANSQECKDMVLEAYKVSELYDAPVMIRMTTRVCHGKSIVECGERTEVAIKEYKKDVKKYVCVPANAKGLRRNLEVKLAKLKEYAETTPFNFEEINSTKVGVITSGACYHYAKEAFDKDASFLKLGFSFPMPDDKIKAFCEKVDTVYIVEENDPFIEDRVKVLGFECHGKDLLPKYGEMTPDVIRKSFFGIETPMINYDASTVVGRPPTLCAGCPHRGFFYELGKRKDVMVSSDIGCYSLGFAKPYDATDSLICMGGGFSIGHGAQKVFNMTDEKKKVVSVMGDS
ncbi:MAG: indolepyruvate ferredoxin oxidoreductase subunit alpha, partial [Anaerotignum sp.]